MDSSLRFKAGDKVTISKFYYGEMNKEYLASYLKVGYCTIETIFWNKIYSLVSVPCIEDNSTCDFFLIERTALKLVVETKFDKSSSLENRVNQFCQLY